MSELVSIEPKLKPLYANLQRLHIGEYLATREFELWAIENDIDEEWEKCLRYIKSIRSLVLIGPPSYRNEVEAFGLYLTGVYNQLFGDFDSYLFPILLNFAGWSAVRKDFSGIVANLKDLNIDKEKILEFVKNLRKQQTGKSDEKAVSKDDTSQPTVSLNDKDVFVVHGHDEMSRVELCLILKEHFKLNPIVLKENPNQSLDTLIGKFERLASTCSTAIVLFTPDDKAGNNMRARQNVIFELGYFAGKLQASKRRIIILKKGDVEIFTDISGVVYFEYRDKVKEAFLELKQQFEHWKLI